ncbi:hypothetical protein FDA94_36060 [Herbidospora galbida]|uniref:Uncharacterized protein n=1 Tax=Herbidospora galbida TaxID=2575442 RepID=A0A4U3LV08_9ACTN|nr:DUF6518 family protein [Herbidospora galbida]TKK79074.1 hypothetical protein FDA94_36060 [Herbidospora galbida]
MTNQARWRRAVPIALGAGLAAGVLTNLGQGRLPGAWNQIANSGAVWSVAAFVAGALAAGAPPRGFTAYGPGTTPAPRDRSALHHALLAGLAAELGLVVGYYGYAEFGRDGMGNFYWPLVWVVMACVAGPVFGVAGLWWRRGVARWQRVGGLAALAGVFGMEAAHYAFVLEYAPQAWACLAVFLLVPLLARTAREVGLTSLAAVPLAGLAYLVISLPLQSLSG